MSIEISETEMIKRFSEGCKEAANCAAELAKPANTNHPIALHNFIHGVKVAAGSAHQIAIYRENLSFLSVRDYLEKIIDTMINKSSMSISGNPVWLNIEKYLTNMASEGFKLAHSKPMSRQDVLANLDFIQKNPKNV
jgi:hypothetical protein